MKTLLLPLLLAGLGVNLAQAVPQTHTPLTDLPAAVAALKPGQYLWYPQISPNGPVTLVVSLTEQRVYVYRNGIAIGVATVSSGRKGKETPTGVFTILQKQVDHHSTLYNDAAMPYMERLTWDGVALHAGGLPGYPSSHGCVHLSLDFARKLYDVTSTATTTVIISDAKSAPVDVNHPGLLAPMVSDGRPQGPNEDGEDLPHWSDTAESQEPPTVLVSRADRRIYVYRGGIEIGTAKVGISRPEEKSGVAAFSLLEKPTANQIDSNQPKLRWSAIQVSDPKEGLTPAEQLGKFSVDRQFLHNLLASLQVGSTLVITDLSSTRETRSAPGFRVIDADNRQTD
ncbi:L,D-transpeptidase [Pseudomonas sp. SCB32]|uniref:L,D-transpeptidase n=1 Tax=Pseudomonas sp. SCB32 TaxID=2653853 RepID=UPI001265317F|nr:L,D-transpeptidase [Pseudomonas sp. SCB32]